MAILVKSGGAYAEASAIYCKQGGVYTAVAGVFAKASGAYQQVDSIPWAPSVTLTGAAFSAAQLEPGIPGGKNPISNVNRIYMAASNGTSLPGGTFWVGRIKGTEAKLVVDNTAASYPNAILVSIDNGAFAAAANTGSQYTLFTGLSDAEHTVCLRTGTIWGIDNIYFNKAGGNIMTLQGTDTYVTMPASADWVYPGVTNSLGVAAGMTVANTANYTPNRSMTGIYAGVSNVGAAKIRGPFKRIWVGRNSTGEVFTKIYVSKNGAAPTTVAITDPSTGGQCVEVGGLDGSLATYYVWTNKPKTGGLFCVAGDAAHVDCGTKYQMHQFGDSITYGGGGSSVPGEVDVLRVAAAMGYVGLTAGIPGHTIAQIETALTSYLAALTVTSNDVAILAAGRNNTGGAFDAAETTSYTNIVTALVAKGYGKIICRSILPAGDHSTTWASENGSISSIVTGIGNANVVFCDVSGLGTYTTQASDTTHPDTSGYAAIAAYVEPLYRTILGL